MAEEQEQKTEEPTQKRLDEAWKRGDVACSQEVVGWFGLLGATLMLAALSGPLARDLGLAVMPFVERPARLPADPVGLRLLISRLLWIVALILGIPLACIAGVSLVGSLMQHRLVFSTESLKPKFAKISPLAGLKRLISPDGLVNFGKGLVKVVAAGAVMAAVLWPERGRVEAFVALDLAALLPDIRTLLVKLLGAVLAVYAVIAGLDWVYQRRRWLARQRMTVQEVREEHKQSEGDPHIKGRIRKLRQERSRKRMMAQVPKASVVLTNPTHYAVALRYEAGMNAPVCVAKGVDALALRIRAVAAEHGVPVVENPPLARALHASVELDAEIPVEHYKAVAEVIGYVLRLRRRPA